jgi:hypothetical protein
MDRPRVVVDRLVGLEVGARTLEPEVRNAAVAVDRDVDLRPRHRQHAVG